MKTCIIHSITIYLIFMIIIILHKPAILCKDNNEFKSWYYLYDKLSFGFNDISELICLPSVVIIWSIISFMIAKSIK